MPKELQEKLKSEFEETFEGLKEKFPETVNLISDFWLTALSFYIEDRLQRAELLKEMEDYDVMVCSKCGEFIRERFSHNSEDGFSQCCGKKLERKQGKKDTYSPRNEGISAVIEVFKS